jgi:hypothetical protein
LKPKAQRQLDTNILSKFREDNVPFVLWDSDPEGDEGNVEG